MVLPLSRRPLDLLFVVYFIIHLPITLGIDLQILTGPSYHPSFLVDMLRNWGRDYDDVLSVTRPMFYQAFVAFELIFHVPFFIVASWAFIVGAEWIRPWCLVYGVQVATTLLSIMPESWVQSSAKIETKLALQAVLSIWLLIPLLLVWRAWPRASADKMFADGDKQKIKGM